MRLDCGIHARFFVRYCEGCVGWVVASFVGRMLMLMLMLIQGIHK